MKTPHDSFFEDNLAIVLDTFRDIDWEVLIGSSSYGDYSSISHSLLMAAEEAEKEDQLAKSRILELISEACSMRLSTDNANDPFPRPKKSSELRIVVPDDFNASEIDFFAEAMDSISNPLVRGRLADLVWYSQQPRKLKYALAAIDSYIEIPLSPDTWLLNGVRCWHRAIVLCHIVKKPAKNRLATIESSIVDALNSADTEHGVYGLMLAETLLHFRLAKSQATTIARKLQSVARDFENEEKYSASAQYYRSSSKWFEISGDLDESHHLKVAEAESHVKDAESRLSSDAPSHLTAIEFLSIAVRVFQEIPKSFRDPHNIDLRIHELNLRIHEYGQESLDETPLHKTPRVDLSHIAEKARAYVAGKSLHEALMMVARIHDTNFRELRNSTIKNMTDFPLHNLFGTVYVSHDGRVLDRVHGFVGSDDSDESETAIRAHMATIEYRFSVEVAVQGKILPALETLVLEHRLDEIVLTDLTAKSSIVPKDRASLWSKAIAHGFNYDFATSIHLLVPQIEYMVRFHLRAAGVNVTSSRNTDNVTVKSLNSLMDMPEAEKTFGEDVAYEIKTLFCDQIGPNLRNYIAHGMLTEEACCTIDSIYAWWFALKLMYSFTWNPHSTYEFNEA